MSRKLKLGVVKLGVVKHVRALFGLSDMSIGPVGLEHDGGAVACRSLPSLCRLIEEASSSHSSDLSISSSHKIPQVSNVVLLFNTSPWPVHMELESF